MTTAQPTALLADDERLMRDQLRQRLSQVWPELQVVAEAANGREALAQARAHEPDIAFLDIRMPEITGIEVARLLAGQCQVVFVTAFDQYAIEAFERGAVDYVLKPAQIDRLAQTCTRLQQRLMAPAPDVLQQVLAALTASDGHLGGSKESSALRGVREPLQWIQANVGAHLRMIAVEDVLFFRADDKYTRVQTAEFEALIRKPIRELTDELDPALFWQIHRSTLVRVKAISHISRSDSGQPIVHVRGHAEKLEVSRAYAHLFKQM